jgi:DNA-directed RNA polymerase subunit RPC12/RpoP
MPRRYEDDDQFEDEEFVEYDSSYEGEEDADDAPVDEEESTVPCPYCGKDIFDESLRCPHCGNYISEADSPPSRKPWWVVAGVIICLYIVYRWITLQ